MGLNKYTILNNICDGVNSLVVKAKEKKTSKIVAIKIIGDLQNAYYEESILKKLNHKNILKIVEFFIYKNKAYMVFEYMDRTLLDLVENNNVLSEENAKIIFKELLNGISYIHNKTIYHKDIKLENILIDNKNNIKICDFGLSEENLFSNKRCGTYIAPECYDETLNELDDDKFVNDKIDVWNLGIVLFSLVYGTLPFIKNNLNDTYLRLLKFKNYKKFWEYHKKYSEIKLSNNLKNLLNKMLAYNPYNRIILSNIYYEEWLK